MTSRSVHAESEFLPWTICLPTLVLIAQAVFLLERGQTDNQTYKQTDASERPTPRRRLNSRRGKQGTPPSQRIMRQS